MQTNIGHYDMSQGGQMNEALFHRTGFRGDQRVSATGNLETDQSRLYVYLEFEENGVLWQKLEYLDLHLSGMPSGLIIR